MRFLPAFVLTLLAVFQALHAADPAGAEKKRLAARDLFSAANYEGDAYFLIIRERHGQEHEAGVGPALVAVPGLRRRRVGGRADQRRPYGRGRKLELPEGTVSTALAGLRYLDHDDSEPLRRAGLLQWEGLGADALGDGATAQGGLKDSLKLYRVADNPRATAALPEPSTQALLRGGGVCSP